jgi:hypothetical protein
MAVTQTAAARAENEAGAVRCVLRRETKLRDHVPAVSRPLPRRAAQFVRQNRP